MITIQNNEINKKKNLIKLIKLILLINKIDKNYILFYKIYIFLFFD